MLLLPHHLRRAPVADAENRMNARHYIAARYFVTFDRAMTAHGYRRTVDGAWSRFDGKIERRAHWVHDGNDLNSRGPGDLILLDTPDDDRLIEIKQRAEALKMTINMRAHGHRPAILPPHVDR